MQYLPIDKAAVPYRFQVRLAGATFALEVHHNAEADRYTVDLYDSQGAPLAFGEPLIYGSALWATVADDRFPQVQIVPLDLSGQADAVTSATLEESVFLYLVGPEGLAETERGADV